MKKGKLFVISGPSGAGKGTICKKVLEADRSIRFSVSMTTRSPREGEVNAVDYHFTDKDSFRRLIETDGLLEHNMYLGNYYGTPKEQVFRWLDAGHNVILEIDYHGAIQVRSSCPECILIFIMPPSVDELRERLRGRGSESQEDIDKRLGEALNDIAHADMYDYRIVNDDVDAAVARVLEIINREEE